MANASGSADERAREDVLPDDYYFMAIAGLTTQKSKDPKTQVGACIVNQEKKIVGVGYNGMPKDSENLPWSRTAEKEEDRKYLYVCHAELNAIMNSNSADLKGCTMYVTLFPCNECVKLIIQAGITEVVYLSEKKNDKSAMTNASKKMLKEAGIKLRQFKPEKNEIVIDFSKLEHHGNKTDEGVSSKPDSEKTVVAKI